MILYPKKYINNVLEISADFLKEENINGLILDVDNTLLFHDRKMLTGLTQWVENMKKNNIKLCILSNTNKKDKVDKLSKDLKVPYIFFAKKPLKGGFKKVAKILNMKNENIAVVGDQIFTDVIGANRMNMYPILTKPLSQTDILITRIKRPLEEYIIKKYLERK